ncbi:hypothetical protein P154DRAFT_606683 [Amniculicola lignicola CBS 123094]|uniref:Uncharacterized protein n=1 Tax=Amniculicola lignicola CBS 123094 TaxID=1392246 RepID=A0A6A5W6B7_9PLEO|nr:hypothetical protein P154DRAFT_606683 [Amniculicola lignicola CBS 123094]
MNPLTPAARSTLIGEITRIWNCDPQDILPGALHPKNEPNPEQWSNGLLIGLRTLAQAGGSHDEAIKKLSEVGLNRRRLKRKGKGPAKTSRLTCVVEDDLKAAARLIRAQKQNVRGGQRQDNKRVRGEEDIQAGDEAGEEEEFGSDDGHERRRQKRRKSAPVEAGQQRRDRHTRAHPEEEAPTHSNSDVEQRESNPDEGDSTDYIRIPAEEVRRQQDNVMGWTQLPGGGSLHQGVVNPNDPRPMASRPNTFLHDSANSTIQQPQSNSQPADPHAVHAERVSQGLNVLGLGDQFPVPNWANRDQKIVLFRIREEFESSGIQQYIHSKNEALVKYQIALMNMDRDREAEAARRAQADRGRVGRGES